MIWPLLAFAVGFFSFVQPAAAQRGGANPARVSVGPNHPASARDTSWLNEGWIAASATNPNTLVGVYMNGRGGCATTFSNDGGNLWTESMLPKANECFDPMVTAGPGGRIYILHTGTRVTSRSSPTGQLQDAPVRIFSSSDEGKTWSGPVELRTQVRPDHPRIMVDQSNGPHRGRIYVAWNEAGDTFVRNEFQLFLHFSDDNGATFTEPIFVTKHSGGKLVMTEPVVLSDGTLLLTYFQFFSPRPSRRNENQPFFLLRSTDGAQTFGPAEKVFEVGMATPPHLMDDVTEAFTLPIVAADISPTSRYKDRIYVVWTDVSAGQSNIWLRWSGDKGSTWSSQIRVNDNPRNTDNSPYDLRLTPVVAVNKDGVVGVAWYDRREDAARRCWRMYFSASSDGGETFTPNTPLSTAPSCPPKGQIPRVRVKDGTTSPVLAGADSIASLLAQGPFGEAAAGWIMVARERRAMEEGETGTRFRIGFDAGRDQNTGHYTGLTADPTGAFHAFWVDRRSGFWQFYTAKVEVTTEPEAAKAPLRQADVTPGIEVMVGHPRFDETAGLTTVEMTLRNVSGQTVCGPLRVRVSRIIGGGRDGVIQDSDNQRSGVGAEWDFSSRMGTRGCLTPRMASEARTVSIRSRRDQGLDVVFEFEVIGRVSAERK